MTFPSLLPPDHAHRFGCDALLSGDASPDGLSCGSPPSPVPSQCDDSGLLGATRTRSYIDPRRGVLIAHTTLVGPGRGEITLLPFRVSPVTSRLTWDLCHIVQIGGAGPFTHADAWRELSPLEDAIEERRIHIGRAPSVRSPLVRERLRGVDLVVGVDETSTHVIARLPVPHDADVAILSADISWRELYGRDLGSLDAHWSPSSSGGCQSTLRLAALMGYVLDLGAPSDGMRPIEHLMAKFEVLEVPDLGYPLSAPDEDVSHVRV